MQQEVRNPLTECMAMMTSKAESIRVPKATHIRHFQQSLLGEVQVVVRLDGNALLLLLALQQPVQADHIALLLHMRTKSEVFVRGYEVCHVLGPILIHLNSRIWHVAKNTPFMSLITAVLVHKVFLSTPQTMSSCFTHSTNMQSI